MTATRVPFGMRQRHEPRPTPESADPNRAAHPPHLRRWRLRVLALVACATLLATLTVVAAGAGAPPAGATEHGPRSPSIAGADATIVAAGPGRSSKRDSTTADLAGGSATVGAGVFGLGCTAVGARLSAGTFHPITPVRILDSRLGSGAWNGSRLAAGSPRNLPVAGVGAVPATATAATINVTVTGSTQPSSLSVFPAGSALPAPPALGFLAGETLPQQVGVAVGAGGQIAFATAAGAVDVIVDLYGFYDAGPGGSVCTDVAPAAVFDALVTQGSPASPTMTGGAVPSTATAIVARVEVLAATANSFAVVWPFADPMPNMSVINYAAGSSTDSNVLTVRLGPGGKVRIANASGSATLRLTVLGYFDATSGPDGAGGTFTITPTAGTGTMAVTAAATPVHGSFSAYTWDWGDGTATSPGATAPHLYATPGIFRIRLTATAAGIGYIGDYFYTAAPAPPGPPTMVTASARNASADVSWVAPSASGGAPIVSYTVTASPGGATCSTSGQLSCTVSGLTNGTAYTFTATAMNSTGAGLASLPSPPVTPAAGARYHPVTPSRLLDSRTTNGGWNAPLNAGTPRVLTVTGRGGDSNVPAVASAVVMNVTVTDSSTGSFVTAYPTGTATPNASNLNFGRGQTIANLVTVRLGTAGGVSFANAVGSVDVLADVVGYYDDGIGTGDFYVGMAPTRVLDSRTTNGGWNTPLAAGTTRSLAITTHLPPTASAVIANVTVTGASAGSFVSVWPSGLPRPNVSNLNFAAGQTIPNLAIVKIGAGGQIAFANAVGSVDIIVDVVGYFDPTGGSRFHAIDPTRVLDDRVPTGLSGAWTAGQTRALPIAGAGGTNVPAGATGVVANVTATNPTTGSFVTVFPDGAALPTASNVNFGPG